MSHYEKFQMLISLILILKVI